MNPEYEENEEYEDIDEVESSGFMSYEELMEARKITFSDIKEHLTGPVISTVIHVVLLAFLGTIVVFKAPEKSKEITVEMKTIEPQEIEPPPPPPEPPDPVDVQNPTDTPVERPNVDVNVDVQVDNISVNDTSDVELPSVLNMKMSNSALTLSVPVGGGSGGGISGKFLGTGGGSKGSRFAFVLDYSASMGGHDKKNKKIDVMKEHLVKAIQGFKGRGQVCIIPFAGGGWLLDGEWPVDKVSKSNNGTAKRTCKKLDPATLNPRWIVPTRSNFEILKKLIYETDTLFGTNWASGMDIALNYLKPKPDVIFFMTDGQVSEKCAEDTLAMVKEAKLKNKNLVIHSIAFGITGDAGSSSKSKSKKGKKGKKGGKGGGSKGGGRCDPNFYLPEIAKITGGEYKAFSNEDIKAMSDVKKITKYDASGQLDYSPPKAGKAVQKEKKVTGLVIE